MARRTGLRYERTARMRRVQVVGEITDWTRFAIESVRAAGKDIAHVDDDKIESIDHEDLVVLVPDEEEQVSASIGELLTQLGPVRIVVMDSREDYRRAGDAMRACAVGYETRPWNRRELLRLLEEYAHTLAPEVDSIERRFGQWREAV